MEDQKNIYIKLLVKFFLIKVDISFSINKFSINNLNINLEIVGRIFSPTTKLQYDVYIPQLKVALEFQGIQHYQDSFWITKKPKNSIALTGLEHRKNLDIEKIAEAQVN